VSKVARKGARKVMRKVAGEVGSGGGKEVVGRVVGSHPLDDTPGRDEKLKPT